MLSSDWLAVELAAVGLQVTPLAHGDPRIPAAPWYRRPPWVAIDEAVFSLASAQRPVWKLGSAHTFKVGKVTMSRVDPIEYHFVLRKDLGAFPPHYRAELRGKGPPRWKGAGLAARLNTDTRLTEELATSLASYQQVVVKPDEDLPGIRVIFRSRTEGGLITMVREKALGKSGFPSNPQVEMLLSIGRAANESAPGVRR
ncbi:MAG: hypothetical protein AAGF12_36740 [Myxococcota bacterium]